ncbi:1-phosphofructokinase family hexose kinase [Microbacterium sp.]|uniref:1-phosphofructokinase family hexose kinase n=1 Tax=Microbacterium sp. TaxID=51671 RepID=UPI0009295528|nr:1-phosphofructokinase family hexose kinase [Microbacterium sp.]MBN9185083.1 1-phosphofructokinase family hexose kinase [Microbacterium sp.]MBN9190742.1 1-phosphofructokinase family hexose kinase [Microbacterium sp.]MBN9191622.1 1-phosphofructokinase family hexose kinase [Microbacterium sp.]OJU56995.1 MAG: phosphofructokinase [Microbacterium sp. 70-38]
MTAPIVTMTMNPALDVVTSAERVMPEHKLRCGPVRTWPGGGGVNVARTILNLGGAASAIYPVGGLTGSAFQQLVATTGIEGHVVRVNGETRECFTVDESATGSQYRFVLPGPTLSDAEWEACISLVADHAPHGGYLVASGSLPPGVPEDFYGRLARICAGENARLVVDAAGAPLRAALEEGVFLIKPSRSELAHLVGASHDLAPDEHLTAVSEIVRTGRAEIVALTLGAAGALIVSKDGALRLPAPEVTVLSAVGAGDAFLAGLVLRLAQGASLSDAFRTAVAAGTATSMRPGTELCTLEDVVALEDLLSPAVTPS